MSNLFQIPFVTAANADKLYFYATGTSTPQNTYTDADLQVAHTNPVVADASGKFAPIYLDPTLPDYRVTRTSSTASGSVIYSGYPVDDVPASQRQSQTYRLKGTAPELVFEETDASANNGRWRIRVESEILTIDGGNDAESAWTPLLSVPRGGIIQSSGTFTVTLTGVAGTVQGTVYWTRYSDTVYFEFPTLQGVSNAVTKTLTGIPSDLLSVRNFRDLATGVDNGAADPEVIRTQVLASNSFVQLLRMSSTGNWTNTGDFTVYSFTMQWIV